MSLIDQKSVKNENLDLIEKQMNQLKEFMIEIRVFQNIRI